MTLYGAVFYLLGMVILAASILASTRHNLVHAVVYLIVSFFGSALLFCLLGAPFLSALMVIIYAGAIMVLFLFVIMMLRIESTTECGFPLRRWGPAVSLGCLFLLIAVLLLFKDPASRISLETAMVTPREFGRFVFQRYGLAIEIMSLLLLVPLVAAIQLGRGKGEEKEGGRS